MKILIIKTAPGEIKVDKATYNHQEIGLARAFRKKGHQCDIVCCCDQEPKNIAVDIGLKEPIRLYCLKALILLKNGFFQGLDVIAGEYDILQFSEYNQMYTWHAAKKYKDKMVVYHGPYYCDFNKRYNKMAKFFDMFFIRRYQKLNTCFITKSNLASDYLKFKKLKNIHTVGVGIDITALTEGRNEVVPFVDETLKKTKFQNLLLYIGRIEPRRNPYFLLKVLKELLSRGYDSGLIIIGTGDQKYVESFFEEARKKGVFEHLIYKDSLEQKYLCKVYPYADAFLLPTIYDIFGMVLLESMFFSMPVLTTVNGGSDMLIKNDRNGFVFETFEEKKWCDKLVRLFRDEKLRKRMGSDAHKMIENQFTWDVLSDQFTSIYTVKLMKK